MATPRLNITEIDTTLGSKHLFSNQGYRELESLCGAYFLDFATDAPVSPNAGEIYAVVSPATGTFLGQENTLAVYSGFVWNFYPIVEGLRYLNAATDQYLAYFVGNWLNVEDLPYFLESTNVVNGQLHSTYGLNTTTSFVIPSGGVDGDRITLLDYAGTFNSSNLTISTSGGETINDGSSTSFVLDVNYVAIELIYANSVWRVLAGSAVTLLPNGIYPVTTSGLDITVLSANFDVYVDSGTGNDANDGTIGSPFLTIQRALDELAKYDIDEYQFTINTTGNFTISQATPLSLGRYRHKGGICRLNVLSGTYTFNNSVVGDIQNLGCIIIEPTARWIVEGLSANDSGCVAGSHMINVRPAAELTIQGTTTLVIANDPDFLVSRGSDVYILGTLVLNVSSVGRLLYAEYCGAINLGNTTPLTITLNTLVTTVAYWSAFVKSNIKANVTYGGGGSLSVSTGFRYVSDGATIIQRNADPTGSTTDNIVAANKGLLV